MRSSEFKDRPGTVVRPPRLCLGFPLLGLALLRDMRKRGNFDQGVDAARGGLRVASATRRR